MTVINVPMHFGDLVSHLAHYPVAQSPLNMSVQWQHWDIDSVGGGANNRVYRAVSRENGQALAIKFYIRDARDRAGREFATLTLLHQLGHIRVPQALWLERFADRPALAPAVVQTWLSGEVSPNPPENDADWHRLIEHLRAVHQVRPQPGRELSDVVLTMNSAADGLHAIDEQMALFPASAQPPALQRLRAAAQAYTWPTWPKPQQCLCRGDTNTSNFVRSPTGWGSVDWEYSGWGDPAFEVADLMAMPPYQTVSEDRWAWVLALYMADVTDPYFELRVQTYRRIMFLWWVARFARAEYEIPRRLDRRLAEPAPEANAQRQFNLNSYLKLAQQALEP